MSSTVIGGSSSFFINEILGQSSELPSQSTYSVRILPPSTVTIQEKDNDDTQQGIKFTVQVARENKKGQFSAALSTSSNTPALNVLRSFTPSSIINMEEGQSVKNTTLTIAKARLDSLSQGAFEFQVKAVNTKTNDAAEKIRSPSQASSNTGTIVVIAQQPESSKPLSTSGQATDKDQQPSLAGQQQKQQLLDQHTIAKAGLNQQVNEGDNVILDASTKTGPITPSQAQTQLLSYTWEQSGTRTKSLEIVQFSPNSPKARFTAPQVDEDTTFTIKLTVRDGKGGQASYYFNILVKNLATQIQDRDRDQERRQDVKSPQEQVAKDTAIPETSNNALSKNHSPTAQTSVITTEQNKQVSITLQGTDPDKEDKIIFELLTGPSHGTIAGFDKSSGTLTYIPNPGFNGQDNLRFKVVDSNEAESNHALVSISVTGLDAQSQTQMQKEKGIGETLASMNGTITKTDKRPTQSRNGSAATTAALTAEKVKQERVEERNVKLKETRAEKIAGQYIVVLKSNTTAPEISEVVNDAKNRGVKLLGQYQKAIKGFTVNIPGTLPNRQAALDSILNNSEVAYVEPDVKVKAFAVSGSTIPSSQTLPTGVNRVDGDLSTTISGDGKGDPINADIAILDTGIDLTHPDLNVYKHVSFVPNTTSGNDDSGHGTQVAGIAAAKDNDFGVVGIAPGARLWSIKVLDSDGIGSLSSVLQGLDYVTQNGDEIEVADMSFGCEDCNSATLNTAITNAVAAGVTIVTAAGNSAKDASTFSPANHADVIAVSAIADTDGKCGGQGQSTNAGADDSFAAFSNYGPLIDMGAPGVQIYSTSKNGGYSTSSGTSMAAPHVAGAAALYMSEYPNHSPSQVMQALQTEGSKGYTVCDGSGHGYFNGDKDGIPEPLLYAKPDMSARPTNTRTPTNGTATSPPSSTYNDTATGTQGQNNSTSSASPGNNTTYTLENGTTIGNTTVIPVNTTSTVANTTSPVFGAQYCNLQCSGAEQYIFLRKWGSSGSGDGQFSVPNSITIDGTGSVYVGDSFDARIQKFTDTGGFITKWGTSGSDDGEFSSPSAVATDSSGNIFVLDTGNNRVQKFSSTGDLITKWGTAGSGDGEFNNPRGIAVDPRPDYGYVYVSDSNNNRIQMFSNTGEFLGKFGSFGSGDGQFSTPLGLAVDSLGYIFVADSNNYRIQKLTESGFLVAKWGSIGPNDGQFSQASGPVGVAVDSADNVFVTDGYLPRVQKFMGGGGSGSNAGSFITKFGTAGANDGQFNAPEGVALDSSGNVYVADRGNQRIQVFGLDPSTPPTVQSTDPRSGETGVSVTPCVCVSFSEQIDSSTVNPNTIIVKDSSNNPVAGQVSYYSSDTVSFDNRNNPMPNNVVSFNPSSPLSYSKVYTVTVKSGNNGVKDSTGNPLASDYSWSFTTMARPPSSSDPHPFIARWGTQGVGNGQFLALPGIGMDSAGNVYVVDINNQRIQKFTSDGVFITKWGTYGSGDGQFNQPFGIAVDPAGNVYVADFSNQRIQKFTSDGVFITKWGNAGPGDGQFGGPIGVAVDSAGNVYVADSGYDYRIQKFTSSGNFISKWGTAGTGDGEFNNPRGVAVDSANNIYVSEINNQRIQKFTSDGVFITKWGTYGSGDGQFNQPFGIAVDPAGNVYVADFSNQRVQEFTSSGDFITKWGSEGSGDGQFGGPVGISVDSSSNVYVSDSINNRIEVFASGPTTGSETIAITTVDKPSPLWGIDTIQVDGTTTGSVAGDVVKVTWGEEPNPLTDTVQIGAGGTWSATHNYGSTATGARNVVATLVGDDGAGAVKATSAPSVVTVQKHPTTLTISVPTPVVRDTTFTASGVIKDTAYSPARGVDSQIISITGLKPNIATVITDGIEITQPSAAPFQVFSCATCPSDANDGTKGNKLLRLNVGGEITVPENTFKLGLTFDESVANPQFALNVLMADNTINHYTNPRYIDLEFPVQVNSIKLVSVAGSTTTGSIRIANLVTGDYHGYPYEQHTVNFEDLTVGQSYPSPLVMNGGSYFALGRSPNVINSTGSEPPKVDVQAQFAGSGAYLQSASGTASYELQEQWANLGTSGDTGSTPTAYDATSYNQPTAYFGSGLTTNSAICASADPDGAGPLTISADPDGAGPASAGDIDFDGICDFWESSSTPGNDATHRYITCPKTSSGAFIDVSGATPRELDCDNGTVKYDLCFTDAFSNVWSGQTAGKLVCPTVGHKDVFVELDYMTGHAPDPAAIKDVIMAFGNAPITKQYPTGAAQTADSFGRTQGITLHIIVDESVTHVTQINVWTDGDTDLTNDLAHIKEGSGTSFIDGRFGKATERQSASGAKILNMKHYVYRWGLFAHTWGSTCGPSGMGETLGNDFLVSLGCGFGERDTSHAGTEGSRSEQAGTLMHELGHTLNLRHGGPAISAVGSTNYDMNCKVNYLSVMNYVRQFPGLLPTGAPTVAGGAGTYDAAGANPISKWEGVRLNTAGSASNGDPLPAGVGTSTWPGSSLDYSRAPMAGLSETSLSEANGVRKADNTVITPAEKIVYGPTPNVITNTGPNVNWNLDTDTVDTALAIDINNVGIQACGATAGQIQTDNGYDDWSNLKFYMLHDTDTRDGAVSPISQPARTPELTSAIVEDMKEEAPLQFTGVLPPPNQDGSTVLKLGTTIPIKLQLKDSSNKLITSAKLTFTAQKLPGSLPVVGNQLFKFDTKNSQYVYNWNAPSGTANQGTWVIRVYENYGTPDQRLLQGPQPPTATGETVRLSLRP